MNTDHRLVEETLIAKRRSPETIRRMNEEDETIRRLKEEIVFKAFSETWAAVLKKEITNARTGEWRPWNKNLV